MKRIITLFVLLAMFAIGAQAQIVGANERPKTSETTTSPLYKLTRHYLRFEVGFPHFASVAYGYQLNPYIMLGGGFGFGGITYVLDGTRGFYNVNSNSYDTELFTMSTYGTGIPIFAEANFSTPKYKWKFVANIKFGLAIPIPNYNGYYNDSKPNGYLAVYDKRGRSFFGAINLGVGYRDFSLCVGISSNNSEWYSILLSYNLPLKVHK